MKMISKKSILGIVIGAIATFFFLLSFAIFEDADKTKNYVCQKPITGNYKVWTEGGLEIQMFGSVEAYNKTSQVEFSGLEKDASGYIAVGKTPAAALTFNDKGKGMIIGSFRVVLPTDYQNMSKIQRDFGSEEALISNLVRPTLYKVVTACGPLMSSLESVSETRTDLIAYITDQLNNGVYKTKAVKTEVLNELTGETETRTQSIILEVSKLAAQKAQQDALRIKYEGEAKAAANRALVTAGLTPLEKATIEKETAIGIAQALAKSNVRWVPEVMINGQGNNSSFNPLDAVGYNYLLEIGKKVSKGN